MADWPITNLVVPKVISPMSTESIGGMYACMAFTGTIASGTLTQNQAYYFPFVVEREATAVKMFCLIGGTSNGNIDVGIYDAQFNYIISSGATAQSTASTMQEFDITDTVLPPGFYWMAVSLSSATGTVHRFAPADEATHCNVPSYTQASAHPLPTTTATPVKNPDATCHVGIVMGVSFDTLI